MVQIALNEICADDVMQTGVLTVQSDGSLQEAMDLITDNHVTGLPVLGGTGECIGVISAIDILTYEQDQTGRNDDTAHRKFYDPDSQRWESISVLTPGMAELTSTPVGEIMSTELVFVQPSTSLGEISRKLVDEDVHRLLVLDDARGLCGIITTSDIVRLLAEKSE